MKNIRYLPSPLRYEKAPENAPDKFVLQEKTVFVWDRVPKKWRHIPAGRYALPVKHVSKPAIFTHHRNADGTHYFELEIPADFYFAVTAAPNFPSALPGACLHDLLYACSENLASALGITVKEVLGFANSWFRRQMETSGFPLTGAYYWAVSRFGYVFHKVAGFFSRLNWLKRRKGPV